MAALLLLSAIASPVRSQHFNIRHYSEMDGLPQRQVLAVHQDSRGFIWTGTYGGLTRYDGQEFRTLTTRDGLPRNTVWDIEDNAAGDLVLATTGGVCTLVSSDLHCLGAADGLLNEGVIDVHIDEDGSVWAATEGGIGLLRGGKVTRSYLAPDGLPDEWVNALLRDESGTLWAATRRGLARFERERWIEETSGVFAGLAVLSLANGPRGLLVGTGGGLFERRNGLFERLSLGGESSAHPVAAIEVGPTGVVWVGTTAGVVRIEDGVPERITRASGLPTDVILDVEVDREGTLWLGTEVGLAKLVPGPLLLYGEFEGLPHAFVRAIAEGPDGRIWGGTRDGLAVIDGERIEAVPLPGSLPSQRIYSVLPMPGGDLLLGTSEGLVQRFANGETRWYGAEDGLPNEFVLSLLGDGAGGAWIGTRRGLARWREGRIETLRPPLNTLGVIHMARDSRGRLWLGSRSGGVAMLEGEEVKWFGKEQGLSDLAVWSLCVDPEGGIWVGTNGDGAFRIADGNIRRWTVEDGLVNDFVWQVLADSRGDVWFYTGRGLDRFDGVEFRHYDRGDGLLDLEGSATAALEDTSGRLWFGSSTGLYEYRPELDTLVAPPRAVYLEKIAAGGEVLPLDNVRVPAGVRTLAFSFSAPSFRNEDAIRFRFRLVEIDESWSAPSPNPVVRFAGLGPGKYTLEVSAGTEAEERGDAIIAVPFTVLPSFWQTTWLRLTGLVLVMAMLGAVPFLRTRRLERERRRLEQLVAVHTRELEHKTDRLEREIGEREVAESARQRLEAQLRQAQKMEAVGRLAGGIAHDFNNLLTSVLGHAEMAALEVSEGTQIADDLAEVQRAAERGASLVSQLLAFSRQQVVERHPIDAGQAVRGTARMLERLLGEDIVVTVDLPSGPLYVDGDAAQIDQVILNLAANARDAMKRGGKFGIKVRDVELDDPQEEPGPDVVPPGRYVRLDFSDDGLGMNKRTLQRAFEPFFTTKGLDEGTGLGLASVYGIVHQHEGYIQVATARHLGTKLSIFLPLGSGPETTDLGPEKTVRESTKTASVVLVVEDETPVRNFICRALESSRFSVLSAEDGQSALELLDNRAEPIDLLLSDMVMPGLSGRELLDAVRVRYPETPVLFVSGYTHDLLDERGHLDGGMEFLAKPFTMAALVERVEACLGTVTSM